jgi:hypothetical protein
MKAIIPYCKLTATERLANTENAYFNGRCEAIVQTVSAVLGMGVCCVGLPAASII